jgi:hypothetical protein
VLYTSFEGTVISVAIDIGDDSVEAGSPRTLFELPQGTGLGWDVSADGERFLINVPVIKSSSVPLTLVVNWVASLEK